MKSDTRTCLVCGTQFPRSKEFCPVCILREAMDEQIKPAKTFLKGVPPNRSGRRLSHRFEHYELITDQDGKPVELGRGAMGVTYKGLDVDLRCPVTLKVISEQFLGDESARLRFLREARAAARIRHSNVASVLHLGRTGRRYFYAMEFVEGETLENLIKRSGRLDLRLALEIVAQVAAGLAAVHKQNLVHRDIKPSNIMVKLEGGGALTAKIIDLGLARACCEMGKLFFGFGRDEALLVELGHLAQRILKLSPSLDSLADPSLCTMGNIVAGGFAALSTITDV